MADVPAIAPPLRLQLLGATRITDSEGADVTPRGRKVRALLAYLVRNRPHAVSREQLLGLLWTDRGEEQARASLRQALVDLKLSAPKVAPMLVAGRQDIALGATNWSADTLEIETLASLGDLPALAALLGDVQGALMADLDGLSSGFDDWLRSERSRFESWLVQRVLALTEAAGPDDRDHARALLSSLGRIDPGNEDAARLGMRLDRAAGDLASLHRRFRLLEEQLKREFDTRPSPETQRLLRELTALRPVHETPFAGNGDMQGIEPPVVLVSPFQPLTQDMQALALILSDDIETALGRFRDLRILSVHGLAADRLEAAVDRAVASYTLSGSVRGSTAGCRVNLRLNALASGRVVWSRQMELSDAELQPAVEEVVDCVAGAILPAVQHDLVAESGGGDAASDPAAYRTYIAATAAMLSTVDHADARASAALFERAITLDPRMVNAHLRLAAIYNTDFLQTCAGHDPAPWRARALDLTREAVRLEPDNAVAHAQLGWCLLRAGDWDNARARFDFAISLGPHHADCIESCGFGLAHLGDVTQGERQIRRAFSLNPFPPPDYFADTAVVLAMRGAFRDAVGHFAMSSDPSLHYLAAETAVLGLLGETAACQDKAARLRQRFAAIWAGNAAATDADLMHWLALFMPLRNSDHRDQLLQGLAVGGLA